MRWKLHYDKILPLGDAMVDLELIEISMNLPKGTNKL